MIVQIISKSAPDWCDKHVFPKVFESRENHSYIKKQNLLDIIGMTASQVTEKTLKDTYQGTISVYISDKVPNVRLKSIQVLKANAKLSNPLIERNLEKLKEDRDPEVREFAKKLRA